MTGSSDAPTDRILATRYRWFCEVGWKNPTLNHPSVISLSAKPEQIDQLIREGIKRWIHKNRTDMELYKKD